MTNEPELVRAFVAEHGRAIYKSISSDATDYRYARAQTGEAASMEPCELDAQLAARCVALADGLGLDLAGIDLRITPAGEASASRSIPAPSTPATRRTRASRWQPRSPANLAGDRGC